MLLWSGFIMQKCLPVGGGGIKVRLQPARSGGRCRAIWRRLPPCLGIAFPTLWSWKIIARQWLENMLLSAENLLYLVQKGEEKSQLSFALSKQGRREENKREKALTDNLEEQFLSLLLQKEEWIAPVSRYIKAEDLREELCRQVFLSLQEGKVRCRKSWIFPGRGRKIPKSVWPSIMEICIIWIWKDRKRKECFWTLFAR